MRCAECGFYECALRSPLGGCPNGEKAEHTVVFTAPDSGLHVIDADHIADDMGAITYLAQRGYTIIVPEGVDVVALYKAASDLVDAVEGYVCPKKGDKYVFRNEVLAKCNALKKLLNETE